MTGWFRARYLNRGWTWRMGRCSKTWRMTAVGVRRFLLTRRLDFVELGRGTQEVLDRAGVLCSRYQ
jgi:hypothetical protein